jgi:hypothetical protein
MPFSPRCHCTLLNLSSLSLANICAIDCWSSANTLTPNAEDIKIWLPVSDVTAIHASSEGGSREKDVTAFAVSPYSLSSIRVDITVTPVKKLLEAIKRNSSESIVGFSSLKAG